MKRSIAAAWVVGSVFSLIVLSAVSSGAADIEKGKKMYEAKRCGMCHGAEAQGGAMGPSLLDVGSKRDADWLAKFLKDPKGTAPGAKHSAIKATDEELADLAAYLASLKK